MAFNQKDDDGLMAEINMTPLIDIMLVLLIIFMVTSSVAVDLGLDLSLPKSTTSTKTLKEKSVIISIGKDEAIFVEDKATDLTNLSDFLKKAIVQKNSGFVVLKGDKTLPLEKVLEIMDIAKNSGATRFAISTEETTKN